MIAFNFVDRFEELAGLPRLRRLNVLEKAHARVLASRQNVINAGICIVAGMLVAFVPAQMFRMSGAMQGLLLGVAIVGASQVYRVLYARLLHERVRELVRSSGA